MLNEVKGNLTYDAKIELRNAPVFGSTELLPTELGPESLTYVRTFFCAYAKKMAIVCNH